MERELRLKAFIEEYARVVQLFDDIVSMKESMGRLETYMVVMVCQVGAAMIAVSLFLLLRFCQAQRSSGEYHLEHRFERNPSIPVEKKAVP
ncbi:hypothetical protein ANCCEY_01376 [Ancylostoma ceylanicum]|uniref:Uncharacterized protein n=3 Tax=Ancylostoma TaxID=29169 RepID=A0A0D6MAE4_9BILA|nr:hypothetical protein ANCCEY_01376 [Ancylostoma ceylanicum]KIH62469.1 hypothetical protein ANCDUO_07250 [Ancylostoma duodenale]RCN43059.1 hypothetical protein ANCCAN_10940 [Ancylostoma caninum]